MSILLLAGDIGGTNTRLLLKQEESKEPIHQNEFTNSKYPDLLPIVQAFLEEAAKNPQLNGNSTPQKACFAVAGLVDKKKNTCTLTNLNWTLDGNKLATDLDIEKVQLINDFEAVGYGVLQLPKSEQDIEVLPTDKETKEKAKNESEEKDKPKKHTPLPPIGVIGAGTGLGEAFILKKKREDNTGTVYPTEGGHVDFGIRSLEEFELLEYIKEKYQLSRVSVERVVSGPGIVAIYQFLRDADATQGSRQYSELEDIKAAVEAWEKSGSEPSQAPSKEISEGALEKRNKLCWDTIQMFAKAYGSEVGNFALKLLPYEGLYIAGGIAPDILKDKELRELFMKELTDKGRMTDKVIRKIPIYLVKKKQVGLIGAAHYASTHL